VNKAIFLTTRYCGTRLPGKSHFKIDKKTVTDILIGRLIKANLPIFMCIPKTTDDINYLYPIAQKHGINFYAGEETNIIKRHLYCAKINMIDYVILSEGDDWLVCPEVINAVDFAAKRKGYKLAVRTEGLPLGLNVIGYPVSNLESANFDGDTNWGVHVTNPCQIVKFNYSRPYKLSMDYQKDFDVMQDVYLNCKRNMLVGGIVDYLDKNPEIANMNLEVKK